MELAEELFLEGALEPTGHPHWHDLQVRIESVALHGSCADLFLEDALESTGLLIGKASKWAKRSGGGGKGGSSGDAAGGGGAAAEQEGGGGGLGQYSEQTRISLSNIDESMVNTDLIEALVAHLVSTRGQQWQQQQQQDGGGKRRGGGDDDANAILIFAPGGWEACRPAFGS